MNWLWFLLWLALSGFVVGAFVWSTRILFRQKKVWAAFAKAHNLTLTPGAFMGSPQVQGVYGNYRFSLVSEEQRAADARGARFRSVVELHRQIPMGFSGAVGFGDLEGQLGNLDLPATFIPQSPVWKPNWFLRTSDSAKMAAYLTEERLKALESVLKIKASSSLLVFDGMNILLRLETSDALADGRKLEAIVKRMAEAAGLLFPLELAAPPPETEAPLSPPAQTPGT